MAGRNTKAKRGERGERCITCPRKAKTRGLCERCYMSAYRKIKTGEFTEDEAIKCGLLKPRGTVGRPPSPWTRMLAEKQKKPKSKNRSLAHV